MLQPLPRGKVPNPALRQALYDGALFLMPAGPASLSLCTLVREALAQSFPGLDPRRAHRHLPVPEVLLRVGQVRAALRSAPFTAAARAVLAEAGFDPAENALDHVRLRAILPGGHHVPAAAPAYAVHRDTWYGSPRAQINWWLPLHDASEAETIFFYPDRLARPVRNDSAGFHYDDWVRRVGWQRRDPPRDAVYPAAQEDLSSERRVSVPAQAGTVVLFAAAQLHGTCGIEDHPDPTPGAPSGWARLSVDFRSVHLADHNAGRGAPDVDCACTGSALGDYLWPESG